jgi:3-isopropylmalate dehydrogenase
MKQKYNIAVLPGDGAGKEVIREAVKVLEVCMKAQKFRFKFTEIPCGAQYYKENGREWDGNAFEACRKADAILLGAVGLPGVRLDNGQSAGSGVIFSLRFGLDLYANVRPTKLYPNVRHKVHDSYRKVWEKVDFVIVRENTEGLYVPAGGTLSRGGTDEMAVDTRIITRKGSERVARYAFELARGRNGALSDGKRRVTCVDKGNVLKGCQLFRNVFEEVSSGYPEIRAECAYVDAFALSVVREPERYDVVVTSNLMGDILTDLAAALSGGLGMAPSGNIGDRHAMFEPVHGSAPDIAGKDVANPVGAVLSAGMMLSWLGKRESDRRLSAASCSIERAVTRVLGTGRTMTRDIGGNAGCAEMGDDVAREIE